MRLIFYRLLNWFLSKKAWIIYFSFYIFSNILYSPSAKEGLTKGKERNMYNQNQVQNPPSAAYWLSMIGGILGLIGSIILIGLGAALGAFTFGIGFLFTGPIGIWILICSVITMVAAGKLKSEPMEHGKWGAIILAFSLIGCWAVLNFFGGIFALVYKPIPAGAPQQYGPQPQAYGPQPQGYGPPQQNYAPQQQQPITRICPQCGRVVPENIKFCPNCGKQLN
jgi:hypothetical protein